MQRQLDQIAETPYFSKELNSYLRALLEVVHDLGAKPNAIPNHVVLYLLRQIDSATKFLAGSTSKRIPYEIVYALQLALRDGWVTNEPLITTAIGADISRSFYFQGVPKDFERLVQAYLNKTLPASLVQISLPQAYRHRPLYIAPLYHELAHFIDHQHAVTQTSFLLSDTSLDLPDAGVANLRGDKLQEVQENHRKEYFADLFACCYVGESYMKFLEEFAPGEPWAESHPSTDSRKYLADNFFGRANEPIITLFNDTLGLLNLPALNIKFRMPQIQPSFDNVRPFHIQSADELHGLINAAYAYLQAIWSRPYGPWENIPPLERERCVNDLVEKSIRNYMIREAWNAAAE